MSTIIYNQLVCGSYVRKTAGNEYNDISLCRRRRDQDIYFELCELYNEY